MSEYFSYSKVHRDLFHQKGTKAVYKKGQLLVRGDEPSPWMFFLEKGMVKVSFAASDGTERLMGFFIPGMTFAQSGSYFSDPTGGLEYEATADVVTYRMQRDVFVKEANDNIKVLRDFTRRMQENHLYMVERLIGQGEKNIRDRCIRWLLTMAKYYGINDGGYRVIQIPLTQDQIACAIHATRESVSKTLKDLKKEKLMHTSKKRIYIRDIPNLQSLIEH